ncbi:arginine--tRNA ligase [Acidiluteibacter ferrifornacis]|uniref:Arginine--tRNA ligase n=1 Tax=Acidiluteibacter ferrifornacis TaxID=2692424 RepID=A0A6N9NLE7_9FLAO|nr:arginine--tRNA ligase [Acidiluteibacter ferrifornacis]
MKKIEEILYLGAQKAIQTLYGVESDEKLIQLQKTRKDFEGDLTLVVFPLLRVSKKSPEQTAEELGFWMTQNVVEVCGFNVVKGFLNLEVFNAYWTQFLATVLDTSNFGFAIPNSAKPIMVEYSSPNTNKPLHLGHLRNNFLGYSVSEILKANGHKVTKVQIVNDRGIHICKSMVAWEKYGKGETPASTGIKGDKLVGNYYVKFDQIYKEQIAELITKGIEEEEAKKQAPIMIEAQEMLVKWENNDPEIRSLWEMMNGWVYDGFESTYNTMGVDFDKLYYESDTFLLGKDEVLKALDQGKLFKKENGSIWIDLTSQGLDNKLLLRGDGTSVYITQDIGTAIIRHKEYNCEEYIYVVGNEQDYHFQVLAKVLQEFGFEWASGIQHLSYGMVDLPTGKMKSREGTVVDADDLMLEMKNTAQEISEELGKLEGLAIEEKDALFHKIGMGALKYYILKVDPKKRMLFNPKESVDFAGNTGPFIQYTYARIQSILRKAAISDCDFDTSSKLNTNEKDLVKLIHDYPETVQLAGVTHSPAVIANYTYDLVKLYNSFYQNVSIFNEEDAALQMMRIQLSAVVGDIIKRSMKLLGIEVPEQM